MYMGSMTKGGLSGFSLPCPRPYRTPLLGGGGSYCQGGGVGEKLPGSMESAASAPNLAILYADFVGEGTLLDLPVVVSKGAEGVDISALAATPNDLLLPLISEAPWHRSSSLPLCSKSPLQS